MGGSGLRKGLTLLASLAALCAGCSAEMLEEMGIEEEEAVGESQSALETGCAALSVRSTSHTGSLIGHGTPTLEIVVDRLNYRIENRSTTDCTYVEFDFALRDTSFQTIRRSNTLTTSLRAGRARTIYWNANFDSRDLGPRAPFSQRYDVTARLNRNGTEFRSENMVSYFLANGQY
jgi:hypothetical protein